MKYRNICFVFMAAIVAVLSFSGVGQYIATKECQPWVRAEGNILIRGDRPFRFVGANAVYFVFYDDWGLDMEKAIRTAKDVNLSVLRLYMDWGWGKDEDYDRILDTASRHGIYVILALTDCCCSGDYSSVEKYFTVHAPFCNVANKQAVSAFKERIRHIVQRKNSINGKTYRDDPVILAWEIANELEFEHFDRPDVVKWINEMAAHIKSFDKNHLVTIGLNADDPAFSNDNSLLEIFDASVLDFFSFHFYPPIKSLSARGEEILDVTRINAITKQFLSFSKPVVMGEFGAGNSPNANAALRSQHPESYNLILRELMDKAFMAGVSGAMFWGWGVPEENGVPMWWSKESHSVEDKDFCLFLKNYAIPQ